MPETDVHTACIAVDVCVAGPTTHLDSSRFLCDWEAGRAAGAWVRVAGELDLATSPLLRRALQEALADARLVALDLRELTFIDTAAIHVILDATAAARRKHGRLVLVRPPASIERVLVLTAAHDLVQIIDLESSDLSTRTLVHLP